MQTRKAEGAPVVVVPGFANNDAYMARLHAQLRADGYTVYGWGGGFNTGPDAGDYAQFKARVDEVYRRHNQKVILVGYSMGGVYAREMARANPEQIEKVVTLAAPFGMTDEAGKPDARVAKVFALAHNRAPAKDELLTAPPVPTLSVYSRADNLVPWQDSQSRPGPQSYNLEVRPGHIAMPFNREATAVVSAWLSQTSPGVDPLVRCLTPRP